MITGSLLTILLAVSLTAAGTPTCEKPAFSFLTMMIKCLRTLEQMMPLEHVLMGRNVQSQLIDTTQNYCTNTIPAALTCFEGKISECKETIRANFSQLAETGVSPLCQPGGGGIDPVASAVLNAIDDEDLAGLRQSRFGKCPGVNMDKHPCHQKMDDLPDPTNLPLDELIPFLQRGINDYFNCSLEFHRGLRDECDYWKGAFLADVQYVLGYPWLGVRLELTPEEIADKLEPPGVRCIKCTLVSACSVPERSYGDNTSVGLVTTRKVTVARHQQRICLKSAFSLMGYATRCSMQSIREMPAFKAIGSGHEPPTKAQIVNFAQEYCTIAVPAGLTCFENKISQCNETLRANFSQLATQGVGWLCQPGGGGLDPAMSAVLDAIDEESFRRFFTSNSRECPGTRRGRSECERKIVKDSDPRDLSLDELVPWMQRAITNYFTCSLEYHRSMKGNCPYWRLHFLAQFERIFMWVGLGIRMPFSPEDLTEALEL